MLELEGILKQLKERGYRATKARKALLDIFAESRAPLSASDILARLKQKKIPADKTTVYRETEFLRSQKIIQPVQFSDRKKRYEPAAGGHHHHAVCTKCDKVEDIVIEKDAHALEQGIEKTNDFLVLAHSLEFYGLCAKCR